MKEIIAPIIFIVIWIIAMFVYGNNQNIVPDLNVEDNQCYQQGHLLWTDC